MSKPCHSGGRGVIGAGYLVEEGSSTWSTPPLRMPTPSNLPCSASTQQSIEMNTNAFNLDYLPMLTDAAGLIIDDESLSNSGRFDRELPAIFQSFQAVVVLRDRDGSIAQLSTPKANTESSAVVPAEMEMSAGVQMGMAEQRMHIGVRFNTNTNPTLIRDRSLHNILS